MTQLRSLAVLSLLSVAACGGGTSPIDAGTDAMVASDAHPSDAPSTDAPGPDSGSPDSGCTTDSDGDGHRSIECGGDDCDDADGNAYPGNPERCDTLGHDEDCNPETLGPDGDHDGFVSTDCCNTQPDTTVACGQDCDDARATVNPTAAESCNGIDDDCNGVVDDHDVLTTFFHDFDGDGYGDSAMPMQGCAAPLGYALTGGDCNDALASTHPGATDGPTSNCDGVDNDCDGTPDRGCPCVNGTTQTCGTSTTAPCHLGMQTCVGSAWGACTGAVIPMPETCNMVDDDCNGMVDDGATIPCYTDGDHDGYAPMGAALSMVCADSLGHCPTGYAATPPTGTTSIDCNDVQATIHPGALENCNMIDDDCDGIVDDGAGTVQYRDRDGDGHGAGAAATACVVMTGYATNGDDCNDTNAAAYPGAVEACDGVDDNCDGADPVDYDAADTAAWCRSLPHVEARGSTSGGFCDLESVWGCYIDTSGGSTSYYRCVSGWMDCQGGGVLIVGADGCECPTSMSCSGGSCH